MSRTNIELDDDKVERVMALYDVRTKRAAVDLALDELLGRHSRRGMLDLAGSGWDGDLQQMRADRTT